MAYGYMKYEVRRHNSYDFSQKLITQNVLGDYMKIIIQKGGLTLAREEMKIWWWWGGGGGWEMKRRGDGRNGGIEEIQSCFWFDWLYF